MNEILAANNWRSNAHLIADVARIGYLRKDWVTLDPTYGLGNWWTIFRPSVLIKHDKYTLDHVDFRNLPHDDGSFQAIAFDPPYKLNGRDQGEGARYGVAKPMEWRAKMQMIRDGITELARVLGPNGILLIKCQDQVCSGAVRWQTRDFADQAYAVGLDLEDRFDYFGGYRPQPEDRRQVHARGRGSTLLVLRKPRARKHGK